MVQLNDISPSNSQIAANLSALGQTAAAGATGPAALSALVVSKAIAAVDTVGGFAPSDDSNVGPAVDLPAGVRVRVASDLFAILSLGAVQSQFGTAITVYKAPTGSTALSGADFPGLLQNRINAAPAQAGVLELKEWMALLSYLGADLGGVVGPSYASTSNFTQFGSFGLAVQNRNASYPAPSVGQLLGMLGNLKGLP